MEEIASNIYIQLGAVGLIIIILGYLAYDYKQQYKEMNKAYMNQSFEVVSLMKDVTKFMDKDELRQEKMFDKLNDIADKIRNSCKFNE